MRIHRWLVLTALLFVPLPASAAPVPDPAAAARLRSDGWNRFRVVTPHGQHELSAMVFDDDGVLIGKVRPARSLQVPPDQDFRGEWRIRWADIERVDGGRGGFSFGRVLGGMLLGTVAGAAVVGMYYLIDQDAGLDQAGVLLAVPIGAIVGTVGGATIRSPRKWETLHP